MTHDHPNTLPPPFPTTSSFTPLPEFEASTPQAFFTSKEVLYAELGTCDIGVTRSALEQWEEWRDFFGDDAPTENAGGAADGDWTIKRNATGFVGSGYLTLLPSVQQAVDPQAQPITSGMSKTPAGIQIPYPSIHLHAVRALRNSEWQQTPPTSNNSLSNAAEAADVPPGEETAAVYLQIEMGPVPGQSVDEDELGGNIVEVLLIPHASATGGSEEANTPAVNGNGSHAGSGANNMVKVQDLYSALSTCQDLHPDPDDTDSGDEDGNPRPRGGLAQLLQGAGGGMPGEGGWITSENAHEFEGEFPNIELGPGAGTRRERDDTDEVNGNGDAADAGEDDTKWQRTG